MKLVAAKTAEVFCDNNADFTIFHISHHALETRPVEVRTRIPVVHIELRIWKAMFDCVLFQYSFLVLNAVGFPVQPVILTQTAIQGGNFHLV